MAKWVKKIGTYMWSTFCRIYTQGNILIRKNSAMYITERNEDFMLSEITKTKKNTMRSHIHAHTHICRFTRNKLIETKHSDGFRK